MILNMSGGSGGSVGLGFSVVGGTTRPKPSQNMLWAYTDREITEYVFSAAEPEAPSEGMLWVGIANTDGTKVNVPVGADWLSLRLLFVNQYIDGEWVGVTAMLYMGCEWLVLWNGELYRSGNQFQTVTGGWEALAIADSSGWTAAQPDMDTNGNLTLEITSEGTGRYTGVAVTKNKIDLTNYNVLRVRTAGISNAISGAYSSGASVMVMNDKGSGKYIANQTVATAAIHHSLSNYEVTDEVTDLDVSGLNGEYYVALEIINGASKVGNTTTLEVSEILLLK